MPLRKFDPQSEVDTACICDLISLVIVVQFAAVVAATACSSAGLSSLFVTIIYTCNRPAAAVAHKTLMRHHYVICHNKNSPRLSNLWLASGYGVACRAVDVRRPSGATWLRMHSSASASHRTEFEQLYSSPNDRTTREKNIKNIHK